MDAALAKLLIEAGLSLGFQIANNLETAGLTDTQKQAVMNELNKNEQAHEAFLNAVKEKQT